MHRNKLAVLFALLALASAERRLIGTTGDCNTLGDFANYYDIQTLTVDVFIDPAVAVNSIYMETNLVMQAGVVGPIDPEIGPKQGNIHGIHIHALSCDADPPGGGHFKFDNEIAEVIEENELWPGPLTLPADEAGVFTVNYVSEAIPRLDLFRTAEAPAIVLHEPTANGTYYGATPGGRLACCPLNYTEMVTAGLYPKPKGRVIGTSTLADCIVNPSLNATSQYNLTDFDFALSIDTDDLTVHVQSSLFVGTEDGLADPIGPKPGNVHGIHVHATDCDTNFGSGHFKFDDSIDEVIEENELWPGPLTLLGPGTTLNQFAAGGSMISEKGLLSKFGTALAPALVLHEPTADGTYHGEDGGGRIVCCPITYSETVEVGQYGEEESSGVTILPNVVLATIALLATMLF